MVAWSGLVQPIYLYFSLSLTVWVCVCVFFQKSSSNERFLALCIVAFPLHRCCDATHSSEETEGEIYMYKDVDDFKTSILTKCDDRNQVKGQLGALW